MLFSEVLGLPHIKNHLITTANRGRIPHAQLFLGNHGSGLLPMAIAYAHYVLNLGKPESEPAPAKGKIAHPDLHFAFPVATNGTIKSHPVSANFMENWWGFLKENPYGSLYDWYQKIGIENKQGNIGVDEAQDIVKALSLKSYEGGFKVMIIWGADKMNMACSNKLLKLIEEPPQKTLFLLIAEEEDQIIQTILSRCQRLHFPKLPEAVIADKLAEDFDLDILTARKVAVESNGSYAAAKKILEKHSEDDVFEKWFVEWVRTAFKANKDKSSILRLIEWSHEIASTGRETQKSFLLYCLDFFRQAVLLNYKAENLVYLNPKVQNFQLSKFAPYINGNNILPITSQIEDAIYHIERNGNSKIILTDLSIKLTRLLHKKAA